MVDQLRDVFLYHGRVVDIYHTVAVCVCCKRLCTGQYNHFGDCFLYQTLNKILLFDANS